MQQHPTLAYNIWIRQDQLILNALVGSLSPPQLFLLLPEPTLHRKHGSYLPIPIPHPLMEGFKQLKNIFKNYTKSASNITNFLQFVKARSDEVNLHAHCPVTCLLIIMIDGSLGGDY